MSSNVNDLDRIVESCLDLKWHMDPVEATGAGISRHDHHLGSFGEDDVLQHLAALKSVVGALEEVATESLDDEIDRTALLNHVRVTVHRFERERPHRHDPSFWLGHALEGLYLLTVVRDRTENDRTSALEGRIKAIPGFLAEARETLARCPGVFMDTALELAAAGVRLIDDVVAEFLPEGSMELSEACTEARYAVDGFATYLRSGLGDSTEDGFAIGEESFEFRLHYEHALRASSAELWRYGNALIEEVEHDLETVAEDLSPGTSWQDVVDRLRADHPPADQLVAAYAAEMERSRRFVEDNGLVSMPGGDLEVVETPPFLRPLIPFAAYQPPGAFSTDGTGWFYVTPPDLDSDPDLAERILRDHCVHELACTALHEGYPGHHLQFSTAYAQPRPVRRVVSTPVTVEGWALYCEEMMGEQGFYRTHEERLFQRLALLWRAVRIVLDVGLHTRGISVDEAVDFLVARVHFDRAHALAEVRRYCAHPAYQLSYAVGFREIAALRESYRNAMGADYSLRGFHESLLRYGGLPVSIIRWGMGLHE
jgi:uncharacterized protein (DUF885 family)